MSLLTEEKDSAIFYLFYFTGLFFSSITVFFFHPSKPNELQMKKLLNLSIDRLLNILCSDLKNKQHVSFKSFSLVLSFSEASLSNALNE